MKNRPLIMIVCFLNMSCDTHHHQFQYNKYQSEYNDAINCIIRNYLSKIESTKSSISVYPEEFHKDSICKRVGKMITMDAINFVVIYKDSTVAFYSTQNGTLKSVQYILFFSSEKQKVINKLTFNMKIIKSDNNFFEVKKTISIAD